MNRRQRRAQETGKSSIQSANDIPLSQPDRSEQAKKTKTLYEIAAEKQAELLPNVTPFDGKSSSTKVINFKIGPNGEVIKEEDDDEDGKPDGATSKGVSADDDDGMPFLETLFLTFSLSAIHFTLEVLTVHQYAQELLFEPIIKHTFFVAFPTLFVLVHMFHGHILPIAVDDFPRVTHRFIRLMIQLIYVSIANVAGCYLIQLTNDRGYYAVMKNAPSVGTIWVWAVLEMGLVGALAGVAGPGMYAYYYGYGIF